MSYKRNRPYIPLSVRVQVAERQLRQKHPGNMLLCTGTFRQLTQKEQLGCLLVELFGGEAYALDHNPALILRKFNQRTGKYTPDANDPAHLIYREKHDHHIKTNVRGDGALRSDTSERMHQRRMDENRGLRKRKPKAKIAQSKDPWGKGSRKTRGKRKWKPQQKSTASRRSTTKERSGGSLAVRAFAVVRNYKGCPPSG